MLVFVLFGLVDIALIEMFFLSFFIDISDRFRLGWDRGYPEMFNFFKWAVIIILCATYFVRWKNPLFLGLGGSALVLLIDDSMQIHERLPVLLLDVSGLRALDLPGDHMALSILVFGVDGLICAALIAASLRLPGSGSPLPSAVILRGTATIIVVIAGFGIGVDALHGIVGKLLPDFSLPFLFLEEGGEMIAITYLMSYFALFLRHDRLGNPP
ncbi:hypothetical protein [Jannaschia faecimaris]|uniref:hypothetical protein n=1 Tax=Jannaschia faecimaris TaxID=1244108 RepID=UPI0011133CFF|nr:hypothetical protein [Jannaschia faecimaris]